MTGGTATAFPGDALVVNFGKYRADREAAAEAAAARLDLEFVTIQKVHHWDFGRLRAWLRERADVEKEFRKLGKVPPWKR